MPCLELQGSLVDGFGTGCSLNADIDSNALLLLLDHEDKPIVGIDIEGKEDSVF